QAAAAGALVRGTRWRSRADPATGIRHDQALHGDAHGADARRSRGLRLHRQDTRQQGSDRGGSAGAARGRGSGVGLGTVKVGLGRKAEAFTTKGTKAPKKTQRGSAYLPTSLCLLCVLCALCGESFLMERHRNLYLPSVYNKVVQVRLG